MIYDIFEHAHSCARAEASAPVSGSGILHAQRVSKERKGLEGAPSPATPPPPSSGAGEGKSLFASIAARLFFFLLLIADFFWGVYGALLLTVALIAEGLTGGRVPFLRRFRRRRYLSFKRALVCAIALFVSLFSPALGTMFACSYFLMYDKKGVEEVVPSVLQDQFKDFLRS
ncbi:MAG: hypothetical protein OXF02_07175 [Simkaniaceae bacterium]|nr:hypothetical protein [Simkaniaceae bacterium]